MNKILVVDDEPSIRESFSLILDGKYDLVTAASGEGGLKAVTDHKVDLAFLDIRMPGIDGLETLKRLKKIDPQVEVIMITAVNDVQKASEAIKLGARDYVIKPFDVDAILKMSANILMRKSLISESLAAKKAQRSANAQISGIAGLETRVMIVGQPGTEKEETARQIHEASARKDLPFIAHYLKPCLSAAQLRSRLFGRGKGATTIDLEKKTGLIDLVRGGTIFIGNAEYLPEEIYHELQKIPVRLIAGSSQKIEFFAQSVVSLPALAEKPMDISLAVKGLLEDLNSKYSKEKTFSPEEDDLLSNYPWPGNNSELRDLLERVVMLDAELPLDILLKGGDAPGGDYISRFEKYFIRKVYERLGANKETAASALEISPSLLTEKL